MSTSEGAVMGTDYHVTWVNTQALDEQVVAAGIYAVLNQVDEAMSTYQDDSDLMRLNRGPIHTSLPVSDELMYLLELSRQICSASSGAFDITVGALVNLWGFGPDTKPDAIPAEEQIAILKTLTGQHLIHLDINSKTVRKDSPVMLDLSAIAKGYAADKVAAYLESQGVLSYMVEVGGEIRLRGPKANGEPWRVAIESPKGLREVYGVLSLNEAAMATSGDYRNYFEKDGRRYSHTIDPRTGYPVTNTLASVSVIAENAALADGWATAMMVLGPEEGSKVAEQLQLAVYFITKTPDGFADWASTAFKNVSGKVEKG